MTKDLNSEWFVWALPHLWKNRRRLLIVAGAGCLLSCLMAFFLFPGQYQSIVRLMPPDAQSAMGFASMASALSGVPPSVAGGGLASLVNSRSPNATFLAIVGSRTAQDDLINRFDLKKVYGCRTYGCARKTLGKHTGVDEDKKTGVVTISVTDRDPIRARDLAGGYVDELNKLVVVMDTSSAHRERVFLEQQLRAVKQDLDSSSNQLSRFSSSHATMDVQRQGSAMLDAATKLQGELIVAQSELSELRAAYSPENFRVREAEARVASLNQELRKLGGKSNETSSDPGSDQIFPSLRELPLLGVTYSDLYRSVRLDEVVYETLTKQYALAKVEEAKGIPTVTVLDAPDIPEKRTFPVWVIMVLCGTLLALLGGAAWVVGWELWRQTDDSNPNKSAMLEMLAGFREAEPPSVAQRSAV
jgi:hypothetical protein